MNCRLIMITNVMLYIAVFATVLLQAPIFNLSLLKVDIHWGQA